MSNLKPTLSFEQGWPILQDKAINRVIFLVEEGHTSNQFSSKDYMHLYTKVYNMCDNNPAGPEAQKLYLQYKKTIEDYISSKVFGEMNDGVRDAVISLINREREGEEIDQALMKNVLDIYVEMGGDSMKYYAKDFEEMMLKDTAAFYSKKASDWIASKSYEDYITKVNECLKDEEERVQSYLSYASKHKLLEVVEYELLTVHANKLEEKKQTNLAAALK